MPEPNTFGVPVATPALALVGRAARRQGLIDYAQDCEDRARITADQGAAAELFQEALIARLAANAMEVQG